jgi:lysophosphatidic acid acyltransferase/lysophosphatidylinositol acyltransferase
VQFAKEKGLPVLKHHLVPRTKGFSLLAHYLRTKGNFKALYDIGFAFPGISHTPNFTDLLLGRPMTVFLYVRRMSMEEVPDSQEELGHYCYQLYQHKDEAYDYCIKNGRYPAKEYKKPMSDDVLWSLRLTMILWMTVLVLLPCVLITVFLSWGYLLFLLLITVLFNGTLTVALLMYSHQPMGTPASPTKKTN